MLLCPIRARRAVLAATALAAGACASSQPMNDIAQAYVTLVLALGEHDPDYVDAYYGPPAWRDSVRAEGAPLRTLHGRADVLLARLAEVPAAEDSLGRLRLEYLRTQVGAVRARVQMLIGQRLSFDEESRALYDAVAPTHPEGYFAATIAAIDSALPGSGTVQERFERYRTGFVIPPDRLAGVFTRAIHECAARTARHLTLPAGERFTVEYVRDKPWSGYNWYQGNFTSLIQVNVDLPIYIDRAVDLACHEGYPGHHVYNALLEQHLVRDRGWVEYAVYPLFSPQSLIAEGTANYGIAMAFPGGDRVAFERDTLFPLAGLDPAEADRYYEIQAMVERLSYAGNEAARRYLDGAITAEQAADWLVTYALMSRERAAQRVRFIERYRSYVINYNLGRDLVAAYVERAAAGRQEGRGADEARWRVFGDLLGSPRLPSGLTN
jgi:hypothetical protein